MLSRDVGVGVTYNTGVLGLRSRPSHYVIAFIEKRQMSRVTCSVREVGEFVNISKSTAYRALKSLTDKGFLVQFSEAPGPRRPGNRRAAIYGLGDPLNLRYGGRGGPSTQAYVYKHFVEGRDSPAWEWVHHRGVCIRGQGLAPAPVSSWPLSIGT